MTLVGHLTTAALLLVATSALAKECVVRNDAAAVYHGLKLKKILAAAPEGQISSAAIEAAVRDPTGQTPSAIAMAIQAINCVPGAGSTLQTGLDPVVPGFWGLSGPRIWGVSILSGPHTGCFGVMFEDTLTCK